MRFACNRNQRSTRMPCASPFGLEWKASNAHACGLPPRLDTMSGRQWMQRWGHNSAFRPTRSLLAGTPRAPLEVLHRSVQAFSGNEPAEEGQALSGEPNAAVDTQTASSETRPAGAVTERPSARKTPLPKKPGSLSHDLVAQDDPGQRSNRNRAPSKRLPEPSPGANPAPRLSQKTPRRGRARSSSPNPQRSRPDAPPRPARSPVTAATGSSHSRPAKRSKSPPGKKHPPPRASAPRDASPALQVPPDRKPQQQSAPEVGAGDAVVPEHPPPLGTAPQSPAPPTLAVPVPIMGKDVTEWVPRPSGDTVVDAVQFWEDGVGLPYSKVARAFRKEGVTRVPWQLVDGDRLRGWVAAVASSDDLAWMDVKRTIRSFPGVMRATPEAMARSAAAIRDLPLAAEIGFDLAQVASRYPRVLSIGNLPSHLERWTDGVRHLKNVTVPLKCALEGPSEGSAVASVGGEGGTNGGHATRKGGDEEVVTKQATRNGKEKGEENEPQAAGSKDGGAVSGKAVEGKAEKKRVRVSWMRHALLQESTWKKAPQLIATSPDRMRVWVREVLGHSDHVEWVQLEAMVRRQPTVLALKPELVNSKLDGLRAAFRSMGLSETSARRVVMESQHVLILTVDTVAERAKGILEMLASTIPMDEGASVAFLTAYLQAPTLVGLRLSTVREKIEMWREAMEGPDRLPEGTAARMVAARPRMLAYKASKVTANFETLLSACRKTPEWRGGWWEDCVAGERFAELAWVLVMPESRVARLLAVGEAAAGHGEGRLYNPVAYVMMSDAKFSTELNRLVLDDNGLVAVRS